ncbi:MAG: hypothetical protein IKQ41_12835 [Clostridia bacterium]|nr:hypothetical protein [Clostridia bacterium]
MEGFLPLLIFWIIAAFIGSLSKNAKKRKQQNSQQANAAQMKANAAQQRTKAPAPVQAAPKQKASSPAPRNTAAEHEAKPFEAHMHEPVMGLEGMGTEGMDCCHDYMLEGPKETPDEELLPAGNAEDAERARMLLQGVIFSEVLGRRPVRRFGGKHA